jgi:hypothetical protein
MQDWEQGYTDAANEILREAESARAKFAPLNSSHEGYAVIAEELDELWDDVKGNDVVHAIDEAVQVGAMALRFIADMRVKYGLVSDAAEGGQSQESKHRLTAANCRKAEGKGYPISSGNVCHVCAAEADRGEK